MVRIWIFCDGRKQGGRVGFYNRQLTRIRDKLLRLWATILDNSLCHGHSFLFKYAAKIDWNFDRANKSLFFFKIFSGKTHLSIGDWKKPSWKSGFFLPCFAKKKIIYCLQFEIFVYFCGRILENSSHLKNYFIMNEDPYPSYSKSKTKVLTLL